MRVVIEQGLFGESLGRVLVFSEAEKRTLLKASGIAAAARELARQVDPGYEQDDWDTELAHVEHGARECATERIPV